jgi:hypothetical protein
MKQICSDSKRTVIVHQKLNTFNLTENQKRQMKTLLISTAVFAVTVLVACYYRFSDDPLTRVEFKNTKGETVVLNLREEWRKFQEEMGAERLKMLDELKSLWGGEEGWNNIPESTRREVEDEYLDASKLSIQQLRKNHNVAMTRYVYYLEAIEQAGPCMWNQMSPEWKKEAERGYFDPSKTLDEIKEFHEQFTERFRVRHNMCADEASATSTERLAMLNELRDAVKMTECDGPLPPDTEDSYLNPKWTIEHVRSIHTTRMKLVEDMQQQHWPLSDSPAVLTE